VKIGQKFGRGGVPRCALCRKHRQRVIPSSTHGVLTNYSVFTMMKREHACTACERESTVGPNYGDEKERIERGWSRRLECYGSTSRSDQVKRRCGTISCCLTGPEKVFGLWSRGVATMITSTSTLCHRLVAISFFRRNLFVLQSCPSAGRVLFGRVLFEAEGRMR
jgi:hypothetical protein